MHTKLTSRDSKLLLKNIGLKNNKGRKIGLYGGSFNPAHPGHLHLARYALKRLHLNQVWLLVSPGNPHKHEKTLAPFEKRLASAEKISANDANIIATSIEYQLGTRRSADTIKALKKLMPGTHFFWLMGADNFATFHTWYNWQTIVQSVPIAIFDRPGYSVRGFSGMFATRYRPFRMSANKLRRAQSPAWSFIRMKRHWGSATNIRRQNGLKWTKTI